jgi:hypothetical protein
MRVQLAGQRQPERPRRNEASRTATSWPHSTAETLSGRTLHQRLFGRRMMTPSGWSVTRVGTLGRRSGGGPLLSGKSCENFRRSSRSLTVPARHLRLDLFREGTHGRVVREKDIGNPAG